MYEGKITGFRDPDVPTAELGRLMAGGVDAVQPVDAVPANTGPTAENSPPSSRTDAAASEEQT